MPVLTEAPPLSRIDPVTDILHGVPVTDPYRWLEEQDSPETRAWIAAQTVYARNYLDRIPERERIRERVRDLLDVETHDSFLKCENRYFFRKRLRGQEQPSIYFREGPDGEDHLLINPASRGTGDYTAVKPLRVSPDGSLLLYEVKQGGERMGTFEILDVASRQRLPDSLPHGYLRGFAFAPDGKSFYYVHEAADKKAFHGCSVFQHILGRDFGSDRELFSAAEPDKVRLALVSGETELGVLVFRPKEQIQTDFHLLGIKGQFESVCVLRGGEFRFAPRFHKGRILAAVDLESPNRRIVEVQPRKNQEPSLFNLVPEKEVPIRDWVLTQNYIVVSYVRVEGPSIEIFTTFGKPVGQIPCAPDETVRLLTGVTDSDEIILESESFIRPLAIERCALDSRLRTTWFTRTVPLDPTGISHVETSYRSKDGTVIPLSIVGRPRSVPGSQPAIMTSYGGFGVPATPQFSALVAFLLERNCHFALPHIRGGSEGGEDWHEAGRRRNRQVAFDDFLSAAEWLVGMGRTIPSQLAIFGGSNSGLLVATAMTQRPDLFCAVLCLAPLLDMVRYSLFNDGDIWKHEFGTADDPGDFRALAAYSPYHAVRHGTNYPATMIVSGDADQNCNPLHARKMTARLQAATSLDHPIILDYSEHRGHSPVLPLTARIDALSDRLAFLSDQLGLLA
jgi:prolyl oligopeptidase